MTHETYDKPIDDKVARTFTLTVAVDGMDSDNAEVAHWIKNAVEQATSFRVEEIEEVKN